MKVDFATIKGKTSQFRFSTGKLEGRQLREAMSGDVEADTIRELLDVMANHRSLFYQSCVGNFVLLAVWCPQAALRYAPGSLARLLCFLAIPLGSLSYPPVFAQLTLATEVLEMTSVRSSQCCLLVLVYCCYCYGLELQHQCKSHPMNLFIPSITIHLSSSIHSIDNPRCWSPQTWTRSSTR